MLFSCNPSDSKKATIIKNEQDRTALPNSSNKRKDSIFRRSTDTLLLMNTSTEILSAIKIRNYKKLISFIHPHNGIRFSPYAYIDTTTDRKFLGDELLKLANQNKKINWNSGWDEKPELLTVHQYFSNFVYDVDFLTAELKSVNEFHSQGTDLNNIAEVYPGCDVVEFFFAGF